MSIIPSMTEQDVRTIVGYTNFQRGQRYVRYGRVFDTRRAGMILSGKYEGLRGVPYRVRVVFDDVGGMSAACSCPIGGYCKHVVALLLTWLARPETFLEQQDVESVLEQQDKAELIALIIRMLDRDPELEVLVGMERELSNPVDVQACRGRVERVLINENEWAGVWEMAEELLRMLEMGEMFVQGHDYENASVLYGAVVSGVVKYYVRYSDDELSEGLDEVVTACVYGLKRCLQAGLEKGVVRERVLRMLFALYRLDVEAGGTGVSGDAEALLREYATADERGMIAGWVREVIAENRRKKVVVRYASSQLDGLSAGEAVDGTVLIDLVGLEGFLRVLEGNVVEGDGE